MLRLRRFFGRTGGWSPRTSGPRQPCSIGRNVVLPAEVTPGCSRSRSRMAACSVPIVFQDSSEPEFADNCTLVSTTPSARTPSGTWVICPTVRTSRAELRAARRRARLLPRPGPDRCAACPANCRVRRTRRSLPTCFRTSTSPGTSPNPMVITATRPRASDSTRPLIAASARRGTSTGVTATMTGSATSATRRPAAAPKTERMRLSASSCVTICRGVAPSAVRTAISRSRDSARVSSSDATFSQPMTKSRPTAPNNTYSAGR